MNNSSPEGTSPWITASNDQGTCVELRRHAGMVEVRDSKDPEGPVLRFNAAELAAWIDGAKRGVFDELI